MSLMNFLPWRQQRRARCLRFWGAMCVGTVLLMFAVIFCLRINPVMRLHALQTELTGMQTVQHALASRQKLASQAQKPAQTRQQRAWQPVLESLSRATPSQVWLNPQRDRQNRHPIDTHHTRGRKVLIAATVHQIISDDHAAHRRNSCRKEGQPADKIVIQP